MEKLLYLSNWLQKIVDILSVATYFSPLYDQKIDIHVVYNYLTDAAKYVESIIDEINATPPAVTSMVPIDVLISIASKLPINQVYKFFKNLRVKLEKNDENILWYSLFNRDFYKRPLEKLDWQKLYKDYYQHVGDVYVFGNNSNGELGTGNLINMSIPTKLNVESILTRFKNVYCGHNRSFFVDEDNHIYACGENTYGQLGTGNNANRNIPKKIFFKANPLKAKHISCGWEHTVIIDLNNEVYTFGFNYDGQLGTGDNITRYITTKLILEGMPFNARWSACGMNHTILIDLNNNVYSFGFGRVGQLGLGDDKNAGNPTRILLDGKPLKAKYVSCGMNHTVLIDMNDDVYSFGANYTGQLGLSDKINRFVPTKIPNVHQIKQVSCGSDCTLLLNMNGEIYSFGINNHGQLGFASDKLLPYERMVLTPTKIPNLIAKYITCGDYHAAIIDVNNDVYVFGHNDSGQLGIGYNTSDVLVPTKLELKFLPDNVKAKYISCGGAHTALII